MKNIKVLDADFKVIKIVDNYKSLIWCKRYNEIGALDLQVTATPENIKLFKSGNYIVRDDDDGVFRIEAVEVDTNEEKDNSLIIGAYEIKKILTQRIVYGTNNYNTTVENVIRGLVKSSFINPAIESRKVANFSLAEPAGFTEEIETQISYKNVGEEIETLCKTYGYGYTVGLNENGLYFKLYQGVNRSTSQDLIPHVVFSPDYDNLLSSKYNYDASEFKNVAVVGGEGEGTARKFTEIGEATGLNRYEIFVDASSVSSDDGKISDEAYRKLLIEKGKEELAENSSTVNFEGIVDTKLYIYKTDFDLGDIVTVSNEFGITSNVRIIEIVETWDDSGYTVEPIFEFEEESITDYNSLLTEDGEVIITENNEVLIYG